MTNPRKRILLTGFEPFPGVDENPTQRIVRDLSAASFQGWDVVTDILPVSYERGDQCIRGLIRLHRPDVALLTGVAAITDPIRLERVALNLDDAAIPDNDGLLRKGQAIRPDAPPAYFSGHPLVELEASLAESGIPVKISNHAGAYLCNHVFFAASHEVERLGLETRVGFVHVPMHREKAGESQMALDEIRRAIELCLAHLSGAG